MRLAARLRSSGKVALLHLALSALVAMAAAVLVLGVWYPAPFNELIWGRNLFLLLIGVDLVCGPLLTWVLYDPAKAKYKWYVDMALIAVVQCGALVYGLSQVAGSRPVFLAFEGDRFRVVQADDIARENLHKAPADLSRLPYGGPRLLGVHLLRPTDPEYPVSIQMAMQGWHPAFRPDRWVTYDSQKTAVQRALKPMAVLLAKYPEDRDMIARTAADSGGSEEALGYLPLVREEITDWVVVVRRVDAQPVAYLHRDGW